MSKSPFRVWLQAQWPLHRLFNDQGAEITVQDAERRQRHQRAFLDTLMHQQGDQGRYSHWPDAYRKRCAKKGASLPVWARGLSLPDRNAAAPGRPDRSQHRRQSRMNAVGLSLQCSTKCRHVSGARPNYQHCLHRPAPIRRAAIAAGFTTTTTGSITAALVILAGTMPSGPILTVTGHWTCATLNCCHGGDGE